MTLRKRSSSCGPFLPRIRAAQPTPAQLTATRSGAPDYPQVAPLAKALVAANAERIVWGTDWPHPDSYVIPSRKATDIAPPIDIDDGRLLGLLADWVPDEATRRLILVDNPAELYDFPAQA